MKHNQRYINKQQTKQLQQLHLDFKNRVLYFI